MTAASRVPSFPVDGAPVSFIVDYDGTISLVDVTDEIVRRHCPTDEWVEKDVAYAEGRVGSRELTEWDLQVVPDDPAALLAEAAAFEQDAGFVDLVAVAERYGAAIEVVSDGMGFYVERRLERLGAGAVPVATNEARFGGVTPRATFPYGHPRCFVCGTCKRERVRGHQRDDRAVVMIGDGTSDRFGAAHADVVFAKDRLEAICRAAGWAYRSWTRLAEVAEWAAAAFEEGRLPRSRAAYPAWRSRHAPAPRAFICGPEVWGPDRLAPPRPASASSG